MINREDIRELAEYESPSGCALSFYYQPEKPKDQSHREDAIRLKDLVRGAMREAEKNGQKDFVQKDLEHILAIADDLQWIGGKAKAIFADQEKGLWREFDMPPLLGGTKIVVDRRFHLRPMLTLMRWRPQVCACLIDRQRARIFQYDGQDCNEVACFFDKVPRVVDSNGFSGFDAGHRERHAAELAKRHYKMVADTLMAMQQRDEWELLVIGCRDDQWSDIREALYPYLQKKLAGRFTLESSVRSEQDLKQEIERLLGSLEKTTREDSLREAIGQAQRSSRGSVGLRHVLSSLQKGEVQKLLIGERFTAQGIECSNCGHIAMRKAGECGVCGHRLDEVKEISEAILNSALRQGVEVIYVKDNDEIERVGNIAALLRFRAEPMSAVG
ncbi:MAG: hypothetical protein CXZ00_07440 [Acidobacteria bacterium]|nr:MAG: hypothetical protein CXZ00_07440 [Acidobacteriota bacterium]